MSTLKSRIQEDMKAAMRAKDKERLAAIRLLLAAIKQIEVDERIELDDERVLTIVNKQIKQRKDSIAQYQQAARDDLVAQEQFELEVLEEYLPEQLSQEDIVKALEAAIDDVGAQSMQDMGKVMAVLKVTLQSRADMSVVSTLVKQRLGS